MKSKYSHLTREDFEISSREFFRLNPRLPMHVYDFVYDADGDTGESSSNTEPSSGEGRSHHHKQQNHSSAIFPILISFPRMTEEEEEEARRRKNFTTSSPTSSLSTVPVESLGGSTNSSISSLSSSNSSCANISKDFINTSTSSSSENSTTTNEDMIIPSINSPRPSTPCSPYAFSIPSPPNSTYSVATLEFDFNTDPQDILDPDFLFTLNDTDFSDHFSDVSDTNDTTESCNETPFNKITTNNSKHHDDIENIHIDPLNSKDLLLFNEDSNNSTASSSSDFLTSPVPSPSSPNSNLQEEVVIERQNVSNKPDESCTNYHRHLIKSRGRNNKQLQNLFSPATQNRNNSQIENEWRVGRRSERLAIRTAKLKSTSNTTTTTIRNSDNGDNSNSNSTPPRQHFESLPSSRKQAKTNNSNNNNKSNKNKNVDQNNNSPSINTQKKRGQKQKTNDDGESAGKISKLDCLNNTTMIVQFESLNSVSTELVPFSSDSPSSTSSSSALVLSKEFNINDCSSDEEEILEKSRRRRKNKIKRTVVEDTSPILDTNEISRTLYEGIFPYKAVEKKKNPAFRFNIGSVPQNNNNNSFTGD